MKNLMNLETNINNKVENGLLFIPDISGFTKFVHRTDMLTGKLILQELLSTIIDHNEMKLSISEIEGDAVLFYRIGESPGFQELLKQFELMVTAFERKRRELELIFFEPLDISLKVIAHYGPMVGLQVGPFNKLYGEVVVQAHELLKNSVTSKNYLLLTEVLLEQCGFNCDQNEDLLPENINRLEMELKDIKFSYFDLRSKADLRNRARRLRVS
ncbi:MAG: DUF2652 domain-containing protein [Bacteroidota bacterium]